MGRDRTDFFVSHAGSDRAWAEWVAWQLADAGYEVELDVWDWAAGTNFVTAINEALERCERLLALFSPAYFDSSRYTPLEWKAIAAIPGGLGTRLLPVRVGDVAPAEMPAILRPLVFCDLIGLDANDARRVLLREVGTCGRPDREPEFPGQGMTGTLRRLGSSGPRLPGSLPQIWNLPARNPSFVGRDDLLVAVRDRLLQDDRAVVQAFEGMSGVGKTQLAIEYAHKFAGTYDAAWWINSEHPGLIGGQFHALGKVLGGLQDAADTEAARAVVLATLRDRGRWLLVFDNAQDPADVSGWLPGGSGHVLITSRERGWSNLAAQVEVSELARSESMAILRGPVPTISEADADRLAEKLSDLPLGLIQAAGFMASTGMPAREYLDMLQTRPEQLLAEGTPRPYSQSLAAVIGITADELWQEDPSAAQLVELCAFFAADPIPEELFTSVSVLSKLPAELAAQVSDPLAWRRTLGHLTRRSLARIAGRGLVMHQLTQAILRDHIPSDRRREVQRTAKALLVASSPGHPDDPATWPRWSRLMPHILAADLEEAASPQVRRLAGDACAYLLARGDAERCRDLASRLRDRWRTRLGEDRQHTLMAAHYLAKSLLALGHPQEARELDQDVLERCRLTLGEDHRDTMAAVNSVAADLSELGDKAAARAMDEENLARRTRELGEDDADTLDSLNNLAADLSELGLWQKAKERGVDCLDRRRRILGKRHPDTLDTAGNLAAILGELGETRAAWQLGQDNLDLAREVLGEDHPGTLVTSSNLATTSRALGALDMARERGEDALTRARRVLGDDNPISLAIAGDFMVTLRALGELTAARELGESTLATARQSLGESHPTALSLASHLGAVLCALAELPAARDLGETTLAQARRELGDDNSETLTAASNLAATLRAQGEFQMARILGEDTLARRRRVSGEIHPDTLAAATELAVTMRAQGEEKSARDLDEDTLARRKMRREAGYDR
jgi:tetratricopeptide (TPR) repeat protein